MEAASLIALLLGGRLDHLTGFREASSAETKASPSKPKARCNFPNESKSPGVEILEVVVAVHLISRSFKREGQSD